MGVRFFIKKENKVLLALMLYQPSWVIEWPS